MGEWMRNWLGLDEDVRSLHARLNGLHDRVVELEGQLGVERTWRREFTAGLRERVRGKVERGYTDFETSQAAMLEEFREV